MLTNADSGAHALVFLLTMKAVPIPQSGWQPHFRRAPVGTRALEQVGDIRKCSRRRERVPVAQRFGGAGLRLEVVREMRQRIAPGMTFRVADLFVAPGERYRLKRDEADFVAVLECELDDRADLIVVDGVHDRDDQAHIDPGGVEIFNRPQLHVEQVADLAMGIGLFADAVELQVRDPHARLAAPRARSPAPGRSGCRWSRPGR